MTTYEKLLDKSFSENITVIEKNLKSDAKGLCKGDRIAISRNIETTKEKGCVLAEEIGHHDTTVGDILDQTISWNRKQERQARIEAYNTMIGLMGIIKAFEHGCHNKYEMAEYLDVTESFLTEALEIYEQIYGCRTMIGSYLIQFIPNLGVAKLI